MRPPKVLALVVVVFSLCWLGLGVLAWLDGVDFFGVLS